MKTRAKKICVIGAGIAGLGVSYYLKERRVACTVYESKHEYGGLLNNFEVNGFRFDNAVHLSFADTASTREIFDQTPYYTHRPESKCFEVDRWLRHPVTNNLYPLAVEEKVELIKGFVNRPEIKVDNYSDWLNYQYGYALAERYPLAYTKKYWTVDAKDLGIEWIGNRMHRTTLDEVLKGAMTPETENVYYAKEMRYPKTGGYKSFLDPLLESSEIIYNHELEHLDIEKKSLTFSAGQVVTFDHLVTTMPMPQLIERTSDAPEVVRDAAKKLFSTRVDLVSVGFNRPDVPKDLWFYIYDRDIYASRAYSPSIKSPDSCPIGCSSLQFEIYSSKSSTDQYSSEELKSNCIYALKKLGLAEVRDVAVVHHKQLPFGNVVFYKGMEMDRKIVRDWLTSKDIVCAGRFGTWDYLWSHQALQSGFEAAEKILENL